MKVFVNTALPYLCARELWLEAGKPPCTLFVIARYRAALRQTLELAQQDPDVTVRPLLSGYDAGPAGLVGKLSGLWKLAVARARLGAVLRRLDPADQVVVGHLTNPFTRLILKRCREIGIRPVAVDDGTTTLLDHDVLVTDGRLTMDNAPRRALTLTARAEELLFSSQPIEAGDFSYFSYWPLKGAGPLAVTRNEFVRLRNTVRSRQNSDQVYFVGQPFVRRGLVSQETYTGFIAQLADHYSALGLRLVYFPHPKEDMATFPAQIEIRRPASPFELYLLLEDILPRVVAGFFSASISLTHLLFGDRIRCDMFWGGDAILNDLNATPQIASALRALEAESATVTINTSPRLGAVASPASP
jgi:hypothetical protein